MAAVRAHRALMAWGLDIDFSSPVRRRVDTVFNVKRLLHNHVDTEDES